MTTCRWFALCDHDAIGVVAHPILGTVPTCARCANRFALRFESTPVAAKDVTAGTRLVAQLPSEEGVYRMLEVAGANPRTLEDGTVMIAIRTTTGGTVTASPEFALNEMVAP